MPLSIGALYPGNTKVTSFTGNFARSRKSEKLLKMGQGSLQAWSWNESAKEGGVTTTMAGESSFEESFPLLPTA